MTTLTIAVVLANAYVLLFVPKFINVVAATVWVTGFLCLLNILLAVIYRKKQRQERFSYWVACGFELAVFVFALLYSLGVIQHVPYPLPPGLSFNRAEIGAALAIGIGLFPAAYWHRVNLSDLPARIAHDGKVMKARKAGVHVPPGEWMN
ncbi:MAG: hypothetical protein J2P37_17860 [Ktedonobacteraceae bacterium]|nr:hypothetical protein [Ktedonobacteraceae bacterium]MBO0792257.1 hypothetical protein [Ktedonobacteraceae bacterium]